MWSFQHFSNEASTLKSKIQKANTNKQKHQRSKISKKSVKEKKAKRLQRCGNTWWRVSHSK